MSIRLRCWSRLDPSARPEIPYPLHCENKRGHLTGMCRAQWEDGNGHVHDVGWGPPDVVEDESSLGGRSAVFRQMQEASLWLTILAHQEGLHDPWASIVSGFAHRLSSGAMRETIAIDRLILRREADSMRRTGSLPNQRDAYERARRDLLLGVDDMLVPFADLPRGLG